MVYRFRYPYPYRYCYRCCYRCRYSYRYSYRYRFRYRYRYRHRHRHPPPHVTLSDRDFASTPWLSEMTRQRPRTTQMRTRIRHRIATEEASRGRRGAGWGRKEAGQERREAWKGQEGARGRRAAVRAGGARTAYWNLARTFRGRCESLHSSGGIENRI